jgi:hypothetical protein
MTKDFVKIAKCWGIQASEVDFNETLSSVDKADEFFLIVLEKMRRKSPAFPLLLKAAFPNIRNVDMLLNKAKARLEEFGMDKVEAQIVKTPIK